MGTAQAVEEYLRTLDLEWRRVADGEWGLSVEAAGWPLHIGLAFRDGLLRAQAEVVGPDQLSEHELLYRNRGLSFVRFAHTGQGAVWIHGELAPELVGAHWLDRLLGMLVEAATVARRRAQSLSPGG